MPTALALCLEDLAASRRADRYLRCVALVGRQPGLRLGPDGKAHWRRDQPVACELWVSADDRLILFRPEAATSVALHRAGRSLELPVGKPVVTLDQDVLEVGAKRLRIHVHGRTTKAQPPSPLPEERAGASAARAAAVVALGAAVAACDRPMEVRQSPPEPPIDPGAAPPVVTIPTGSATTTTTDSGKPPQVIATSASTTEPTGTEAKPTGPSPEPIEVREQPPDIVMDE